MSNEINECFFCCTIAVFDFDFEKISLRSWRRFPTLITFVSETDANASWVSTMLGEES